MRPTPFSRSHLGIATVVVITLVAAILATSSTTASVQAQPPEPEFLTWEGEPFDDGLNHFVIAIESETTIESADWLRVDDDQLVAIEAPPREVDPNHIDSVVTTNGDSLTSTEETVSLLTRHSLISSVESVGFGIFAVSGSISLDELGAQPGVLTVAHDPSLTAATVDPYFPTQWGLDNDGDSSDPWTVALDADIDAPEGWHRTRGSGVIVAVVDSGVDVTHPDLAANVWVNSGEVCGNGSDDDGNGYVDDCRGWDFANGVSTVTDHVGHGTHVAGIIAAEADNGIGIAGVAYEAEIMALKIGDGTPALSAGIEAIAYAIDNGARVINTSWVVDDPAAAPFLDTAIAAAERAGVLVVTAAGNEPIDVDATPIYPAASALSNVITVGASTPTDEPANWSGYGQTTVDIFAPGEFIISTVPGGYGVYSGTSMAAPMVSGAAAMLWAATPEATYEEVKAALLDRSDGPNDGVTAFRDLAVSDGRLNINRSIYSAPLFQPPLMYNFHFFHNFEPDVPHKVAITAQAVDPDVVPPDTALMYRAGLYVPVVGQPMAVTGHPLTYTGAGGDLTVLTDHTGRALVGRPIVRELRPEFTEDGDFTPIATELPAGTYAFVMELVEIRDHDESDGNPEDWATRPETSADHDDDDEDDGDDEDDDEDGDDEDDDEDGDDEDGDDDDGDDEDEDDDDGDDEDEDGDGDGDGDEQSSTLVTHGDPAAVFFLVTEDGEVREMPQIPIGGSPTPTTTSTTLTVASTTSPVSSTTVATTTSTPGTAPTTAAPATTTTTATATTTTTTVTNTTTTLPGSPTTTVPPTTTTAPLTTTTSAPVTTTSQPATTTTTGAPGGGSTPTTPPTTAPVAGMTITGVNPAEGPTNGRTLVTITGRDLPELPDVFFGSQRAEIVSVIAPTFIVVDTPPGEAGWVNVRIVDRETDKETVLDNAFLYIEEGVEPPPSTTTTTSADSGTTTTLSVTTTSMPGVSTTSSVITTLPPASTTSTPPINIDDTFDDWRDSMLRTPEGLNLAPPASDDPISRLPLDAWIGAFCDEPVCPGWVLES